MPVNLMKLAQVTAPLTCVWEVTGFNPVNAGTSTILTEFFHGYPLPGIFMGVKGGQPAHKAENLTAICELIVWKILESPRLTPVWVSTISYRNSFTFRQIPK
jgi:hypothetical protein